MITQEGVHFILVIEVLLWVRIIAKKLPRDSYR